MSTRLPIIASALVLAAGGIVFAATALAGSDESELDALATALAEGSPEGRVGRVMSFIDPSQQPVRVSTGRSAQRFDHDDDHRLQAAVQGALEPFAAGGLELVQRTVVAEGDNGLVAVRVRTDEGELHDATLRLVRSGQGWLVTDLQTP